MTIDPLGNLRQTLYAANLSDLAPLVSGKDVSRSAIATVADQSYAPYVALPDTVSYPGMQAGKGVNWVPLGAVVTGITNSGISSTAGIAVTKLAAGPADTVLTGTGTTNVWQKIVDANVATTAAVAVSKLAAGSNSQILMTLGGTAQWGSLSALGIINGSGTTNYVAKFTGSTTIGNSSIFDAGAGVAIGHASPIAALDVRGSSASTAIVIADTGTANASWALVAGFQSPDNGVFYLLNNNNSAVPIFVRHTGLVGIGTTDPLSVLDVNGVVTLRSQTLGIGAAPASAGIHTLESLTHQIAVRHGADYGAFAVTPINTTGSATRSPRRDKRVRPFDFTGGGAHPTFAEGIQILGINPPAATRTVGGELLVVLNVGSTATSGTAQKYIFICNLNSSGQIITSGVYSQKLGGVGPADSDLTVTLSRNDAGSFNVELNYTVAVAVTGFYYLDMGWIGA